MPYRVDILLVVLSIIFYELTGVDTIAANSGYASGNKGVIKKVRKLEKDIELDMGKIYVLKRLLGFE